MSVARLGVTCLAMAGVALTLLALAGDPVAALETMRRAPEMAAGGAPETVVLAVTGVLAWGTWAWGAVGLVLTAAGGLPGLAGAFARTVARALVPGRLRGAAALALGMGLAVAGPAAAAPPTAPPDWPPATTGSSLLPDGPSRQAADDTPAARHVVVPGDCLWQIAEDHLDRSGSPSADADVARAVTAWWSVNAEVIGPDPDLIHPGQSLQAPPAGPHPDAPDSAGGPR